MKDVFTTKGGCTADEGRHSHSAPAAGRSQDGVLQQRLADRRPGWDPEAGRSRPPMSLLSRGHAAVVSGRCRDRVVPVPRSCRHGVGFV